MIAMSGRDFFNGTSPRLSFGNDFYRSEYFAHASIRNCHGDVNYWLGLPALGGAKGF
jgi:hypothetical protein